MKEIAVILLHPICNMTCRFCAAEAEFDSMSMKQAGDLVSELKCKGVRNIVLGGGEPYLWPHLNDLLSFAKTLGLFIQIGTNGVNLPEGFERNENIDRYILPIESMDEGFHNRLRLYRSKHFSVVMERLRQLKAASRPITVSTVVTRQNTQALVPIARFLESYNEDCHLIHAWHLYRFIPEGRGGFVNQSEFTLTKDQYHQACRDVKEMDLSYPILKRPQMYESPSADFFWYHMGKLCSTRDRVHKQIATDHIDHGLVARVSDPFSRGPIDG